MKSQAGHPSIVFSTRLNSFFNASIEAEWARVRMRYMGEGGHGGRRLVANLPRVRVNFHSFQNGDPPVSIGRAVASHFFASTCQLPVNDVIFSLPFSPIPMCLGQTAEVGLFGWRVPAAQVDEMVERERERG